MRPGTTHVRISSQIDTGSDDRQKSGYIIYDIAFVGCVIDPMFILDKFYCQFV